MKTFIATLLVFFLSLPMAHAGDVDGHALSCKLISSSGPQTSRFIFENGYAYEAFVTKELPLRIQNTDSRKYTSTVDTIEWPVRIYAYVLDRKNLTMERAFKGDNTNRSHWQCEVKTPAEITGTLNQILERLKKEAIQC